jgi:hypothetical protein
MSYPYLFATANERSVPKMPQEKVRADFLEIYVKHPTILFLQEMWPARYRALLREIFKGYQFWLPTDPKRESTGIAVSKPLDIGQVWTLLAHLAIPGIVDRRVITIAKVYDPMKKAKFTAMSFHPVPGAWNRGWRPFKKLRQTRWKNAVRHLCAAVEHQVNQGRPVVVGMDANADLPTLRKFIEEYYPKADVKYVANGIDILAFFATPDEEWFLDRENRHTFKTNSDHVVLTIPADLRKHS